MEEVKRKQAEDGFLEGTNTIELDAAPGATRPGTLFHGVIEGTELTTEDFRISGTVFGNWTFVVSKDKDELFENSKEVLKERVSDLYNSGRIRYGSW